MSNAEALEVLQKESRCRSMSCDSIGCDGCKYHIEYNQLTWAIKIAIVTLENAVRAEDDGR